MTRLEAIGYEVVDLMPKELAGGTLYVSIEFAVAIHLCCCGCGNRVVTPLSPAQWSVTFDGETVSLSPSIGSHDLACASHYWIRRGKVRWVRPWDADEIADGRAADRNALQRHYDGLPPDPDLGPEGDPLPEAANPSAPERRRGGRFLRWL